MGKGRPAPRETAKEKKASPQKAVSTRSGAKKAAAVGAEAKKTSPPNAKKPAPIKEAGKSVGRKGRPAEAEKTAEASEARALAPSEAATVKLADAATARTPTPHEPAVQKPVVPAPAIKSPPVPFPESKSAVPPEVKSEIKSEAQADELEGVRLPAAGGKVGVFGGPKDRSVKPDDKLGLPTGRHYQYEQFRSLNPKGYYCAMRWEYRQRHMSAEEGKRWWANKKIAVTNPANNKSVVVRAVDYGPHESSGLAIAISPGAAEAIGIEPGQEVEVAFADEKSQLGPLTGPPDAAN
jgi:hypothetical protein